MTRPTKDQAEGGVTLILLLVFAGWVIVTDGLLHFIALVVFLTIALLGVQGIVWLARRFGR